MKKIISQRNTSNKGFTLLFASVLSSIILAIAFGISNIALKEINFSTSAKNTNDAFFAADVGAECAIWNDSVFTPSAVNPQISCNNTTIITSGSFPLWNFTIRGFYLGIPGLGGGVGSGCAKVEVYKDDTSNPPITITTVTSRGYDTAQDAVTCDSPSTSGRVEREIQVTY